MVRRLCQKLNQQIEVRQSLSKLREAIKKPSDKTLLLSWVEDGDLKLEPFLQSDDGKTRKNTALLMGDLSLPQYKEPLFSAYEKENTLFIRSSYLKSLLNFDVREYLPQLKKRLEDIIKMNVSDSDKKHYNDEIKYLRELIFLMEGPSKHQFQPKEETFHCILRTNPLHSAITLDQIMEDDAKITKQGVIVTTNHLEKILPIRTYNEILFQIPGMVKSKKDVTSIAKTIVSSSLTDLLEATHEGASLFYFRLGTKSKMTLPERSRFTKELGLAIESLSNGTLVNSPSHYEIELRLIESVDGYFYILVKLCTINDFRFAYRVEHVPTSIKPVNAALLVELAKDYMIGDAQVLDPFCGVGTMLIERQIKIKANTSYGIDIYGEAIEKAKTNTEAAGQIIHFINKDCFDFTHEYSFDEIFTEMPFAQGSMTKDDVEDIYNRFFQMARRVLTPEGTIILYTRDFNFVKKYARAAHYTILKDYLISQKENAHLVILR